MADDKDKVSGNNAPDKGGKPDNKPAKASKKNMGGINDRAVKWVTAKKSEYLAEFKRIVWPTREELLKETLTVIMVSLIFGAYIAMLDGAFGFLLSRFSQFASALFS